MRCEMIIASARKSGNHAVAFGAHMESKSVHASPTKGFFIFTITKDISLEDCILDLIDNSIDGCSRVLGHPEPHLQDGVELSNFHVDISFGPLSFSIIDNCGGISLDDAVNYAFTFGKVEQDNPEDYSIGLYGIGMKRAVFKMGTAVSVVSTTLNPDQTFLSFEVPIDVHAWRRQPEWDFDLAETTPLPEPGVRIVVNDLHPNISTDFSNPDFETGIRRIIARDYSQFLSKGLIIRTNGRPVQPYEFNFLESDNFKPYRQKFKLNNVDIEIVAGLASRPPESYEPDEDGVKEDRSGWYVICNGRIVLAADKSELTGWGLNGKNRWHPQYMGFLGIITFSSKNAHDLPLTTTKRSVDTESTVYRLALVKMIELTRSWIDYTNQRRASIAVAREFESQTTAKPLNEIVDNKTIGYPSYTATVRVREVVIQFPKPQAKVRQLAMAFGSVGMSAREVGSRAFDYALDELGR